MIINICGGGRWALEILQESLKIKKIKKINIITKNEILYNKYKKFEQIKFYKGVNKHLLKLKYKTIICNKFIVELKRNIIYPITKFELINNFCN